MAAYRRVYDSRHLQADCQEPGSAPEPYARLSSMSYLFYLTLTPNSNYNLNLTTTKYNLHRNRNRNPN